MHFGNAIKAARESRGLNQEQFAKLIHNDITYQAVQRWEHQELPPYRSEHLPRICAILDIPVPERDLFGGVSSRVMSRQQQSQAPHTSISPLQLIELLRERLPEDLRKNAGGSIKMKHLRIVFPYASSRVIAHAMYGTPSGASRIKLRGAAWRMTVAMLGTNDVFPMSRHYLLAAIELPGGIGTNALPPPIAEEGQAAGIYIEALPDIDAFIARIVALENEPTEMDNMHSDNDSENFDDLI